MKKNRRMKVFYTLPEDVKLMFDMYSNKYAINQSKYIEKMIIESLIKSGDYETFVENINPIFKSTN